MTVGAQMSTRKELPATLLPVADRIAEAWSEYDGCFDRGLIAVPSWWVVLARGLSTDEGTHAIHERTLRDCLSAVRSAGPCDCTECVPEDSCQEGAGHGVSGQ